MSKHDSAESDRGLTDELLADMWAIAVQATPGPWKPVIRSVTPESSHPHTGWVTASSGSLTVVDSAWDGDVFYIATFDPPTVLALIAEIQELRTRVTPPGIPAGGEGK